LSFSEFSCISVIFFTVSTFPSVRNVEKGTKIHRFMWTSASTRQHTRHTNCVLPIQYVTKQACEEKWPLATFVKC